MSVEFSCPGCQKTMRIRQEHAGRVARCPGCQSKVRIPAPDAAAPAAKPAKRRTPGPSTASTPKRRKKRSAAARSPVEPEPTRLPPRKKSTKRQGTVPGLPGQLKSSPRKLAQSVMGGFTGSIEPIRRGWMYRIAVAASALFVILLPMLYVALIGLVGWGVYWHAANNVSITSMGTGGRARIVMTTVYLAPIVAGGMAILFMLKPIFARPSRLGGQATLNPAGQRLLYEFVNRICETVNAPKPARIDVDLNVNASAGYGGGMLSVIRSDLVLTIGLPLVAGMSLQQFAGILAHEFGHFRQGGAMRVSWIVRTINHWFARVVFQRDAMDDWLIETSESLDFRAGWIFWLARFTVFLSRGILWCFMMVSHAATCGLARQMEFDADRYETRLVGTETFRETCFRLNWLNYALQDFLKTRRIRPDSEKDSGNPVRDYVRHADSLNEHELKRIRRRMQKAKTGMLDTHPADTERIASAEQEDCDGVFRSRLPAEAVISDFDRTCLALMLH